jgi:hypothetical protein
MAQTPEGKFKDKVLKDLKQIPRVWAEKIQQVAKVGTHDIFICVNGKFLSLELKGPKGFPSEMQLYKARKIRKAGGLCWIVYPHEWPEVLEKIKRLAGSII